MSRLLIVCCSLAAFVYTIPAQPAHAEDGAWYEPVVARFEDAGYVEAGSIAPQAPAVRWKFVDLLLRLKGGVVHGPFASTTFDDVSVEDPRYFLFEEAAAQGWVRGADNCIGTHPCFAHPGRAINRAEAAALLVRAFGLETQEDAPTFPDVSPGDWYVQPLRTAASHCIFRGDDVQRTVRPDAVLNQAEMLTTLARTTQSLRYPSCEAPLPELPFAPSVLQIQIPLPQTFPVSSSSSLSSGASSSSLSVQSSLPISSQSSSATASFDALRGTSASSFSSVRVNSDYAQFLDRYNKFVAEFGVSLVATQSAADDTNLRVLSLLKAQIDMIASYYQYVAIARQRQLSAGERQVADSLRIAIETAFSNIQVIQSQ